MTTITTRTDLLTWIHNSNPWGIGTLASEAYDVAADRLASAIQRADHPSWGDDWEEWLDAQDWQTLVEDASEVQS